jgi:hypothetical protein
MNPFDRLAEIDDPIAQFIGHFGDFSPVATQPGMAGESQHAC